MLVWSMHSESLYAERALRAGALGYVNKDQATDKIVEGIRRVLEGKVYLSDAMVETMLQRAVGGGAKKACVRRSTRWPIASWRSFVSSARASRPPTIAERLHLSVKTIETYRERIREKLDLSDGTELAHYATQVDAGERVSHLCDVSIFLAKHVNAFISLPHCRIGPRRGNQPGPWFLILGSILPRRPRIGQNLRSASHSHRAEETGVVRCR